MPIDRILITLLCLFCVTSCGAQEQTKSTDTLKVSGDEIVRKYHFLNLSADTIVDQSGALKPLAEQLKQLFHKSNETSLQVPIIHYGDSHIQAGYMTETVRRRLQTVFGNAGRGFVVPLKLASSNEPRDYSISSKNSFSSTKIVNKGLLDFDPGVSGVAIKGNLPIFTIKTRVEPEDTLNYSFNRVTVFHDSLAPMITANEQLLSDGYGSDIFFSYTTNIELKDTTSQLELYTYKDKQFSQGPFYGFSLENSKSGVLYHSFGVNSACYLHWGLRPKVTQQSVALNPSLIIISMGANEAAGRNFIESVFLKEVNIFVDQLKKANPNCPILIVAPTEAMRRSRSGYWPNTNYTLVRNALRQYCSDNRLAFFDLFQTMGGINSSRLIDRANLMQRDKLHFSIAGYNLQGLLIYRAIVNEFMKYDR